MLRVRPIHFTHRPEEFFPIFDALGFVRSPRQPSGEVEDWIEFDAGSGRLALHWVPDESPLDGVTKLGFEVRVLDEFIERTRAELPREATIRRGVEEFGEFAAISAPDGISLQADQTATLEQSEAANHRLRVNQLWLTPQTASAVAVLEAMGARRSLSAQHSGYTEMTAKNGGLTMVHPAESPSVGGLSLAYQGPVEAPLAQLLARGIEAHIVDETYGRTLHIANPDDRRLGRTPTGPTIWVDEDYKKDGYGYTQS